MSPDVMDVGRYNGSTQEQGVDGVAPTGADSRLQGVNEALEIDAVHCATNPSGGRPP